jgi:hypothetical protein
MIIDNAELKVRGKFMEIRALKKCTLSAQLPSVSSALDISSTRTKKLKKSIQIVSSCSSVNPSLMLR